MPEPRANRLPGQKIVNRCMRTALRTPGLSRGIGKRLVLIEVVGRRSGRHFEVPVAYMRQGDDILFGTPFPWGRNLRTGDQVEIVLKGVHRMVDVTAYTDEHDVIEMYDVICRDNHQFAKFNKIALDGAGEPSHDDIGLAWQAGARAFRLTPQGVGAAQA
jgi:hypothetical protein